MAPKKNPYNLISDLSYNFYTWNTIHYLLDWDQETYMPSHAIDLRASQASLIAAYTHKLKTSPKFGQLLSSLIDQETGHFLDSTLSPAQKAAVLAWRRDYLQAVKIPTSFVKKFTTVTSKATAAWSQAKKTSSFKEFAPHLEKIVTLNRKKADYLGFKNHPYDALLDLYEPESTTAKLQPLFAALKIGLKQLLHKIGSKPAIDTSFLKTSFDPTAQLEFGKKLLLAMGFTPETSRLDLSSHPFCMPIHPTDTRMTTRIHTDDLMSNIFSVIHEGGHGLYCQGLSIEHFGTPLGEQASLGLDESQSRFWETRIGRTRPFWRHFFPQLQQTFPSLNNISLDQFYAAINVVKPSFIRVEADEVTYTLHVILRFEIESELVAGTIKVKEIPELWNHKMKELLGITPPNDTLGCLQDIHWSLGSLGYFPTYALGNLYAAQFFETFAHDFPRWEENVSKGDLSFIREWLRIHIHQWGRQFSPHELIERITGKPLSEKPYLHYLTDKYQKIYDY